MDGSNYVNVKDQSKLEYGLMMLLAGIYNYWGLLMGWMNQNLYNYDAANLDI